MVKTEHVLNSAKYLLETHCQNNNKQQQQQKQTNKNQKKTKTRKLKIVNFQKHL